MQSFIARFPVSVAFNRELTSSAVSVKVGAMFGRSRIGSRFSAVLIAAYEGRSLTTDIEFDVVSTLGCDAVVGSDWLAAWRQVGHEDLPVAENIQQEAYYTQLVSSALGIDIRFSKRFTAVNDEKDGFPTECIRYTIAVNNNSMVL
jgi:hypothetical protein